MSWVSDAAIDRLRAVANWPDFAGTRYTVEREIGRGGMGTVFLGRDEALGRDVAIKVTNSAAAGGELERRMQIEARVLADLEHPGIVPIHDVGVLADGRLFTVMKLVRGTTLGEHLKAVPDLVEKLRLFERLCEPVAFAHARGTVHRDLKPSNVMIGAFGEVLVMDWGISKSLRREAGGGSGREERVIGGPGEGETDPGTVMGTRGYMAPEQLGGAAVDARADVHALGRILLVMLTGEEPQTGTSVTELQAGRRGLPKRLRAICLKATAASPGDRYAGAAELAEDVVRFRQGQPVSAYPESALDRAARLAVTYRAPILLVLTYLVVRAAIAVVFHR